MGKQIANFRLGENNFPTFKSDGVLVSGANKSEDKNTIILSCFDVAMSVSAINAGVTLDFVVPSFDFGKLRLKDLRFRVLYNDVSVPSLIDLTAYTEINISPVIVAATSGATLFPRYVVQGANVFENQDLLLNLGSNRTVSFVVSSVMGNVGVVGAVGVDACTIDLSARLIF